MKTIPELSREHGIPRSTLRSRFKRLNIPYDGIMFVSLDLEKKIIHDSLRMPKNLVNKINPLLVFAFKEEYTTLSNFEISQCLSVPFPIIENILNNEYFTVESKLNFMK